MTILHDYARKLAPLALLALPIPALAQDTDRMDQVVSAEADGGTYMGSVLVAQGDDVLFERSYGSADLEWNIPNDSQTKFRIGSVTKQFTAASILLLQERGELDIDQPVKTYWSGSPATWDEVTVRQLMTHTAGIPSVTQLDDFKTFKFLPTTREELIARFDELPLEFVPGEKFQYSNSGYLMLSAIIEEVSGQPYEQFLEENILTPLGMNDTGLDVSQEIIDRRASGYAPSEDGIVNAEYVNMAIPQGAGALYSTAADLLKWQKALFSGKVLKAESLAAMLTPNAIQPYGLGVIVQESDEGETVWHSGGIEGFNSWLGHDREHGITVVVLANLNGGAANDLGTKLMTLARGGEVELAVEREEVVIDAAMLAQYEGTYAISPEFKLKFWVDGDQLMTQATGQQAFPVFAQGEDSFFLKVVDAKLDFNRGDDGEIVSVTLHQGGNTSTGTKE